MHRKAVPVVLALAALVVSASGLAAAGKTSATAVRVSMTEFKFTLSKKVVAKGAVTFTVVNKGSIAHDFKIYGKKTRLVAPGKAATLKVVFARAGKYKYLCTVPGHATAGMKGVLTVR